MIDFRFRPRKNLGQNFVVDESFVSTLVDAAKLKKTDKVLEIGPGIGFLTRALLEKSNVVAVEKDSSLCTLLAEKYGSEKLELIEGDFLSAKLPKFNKVVSLPPYNISKDLMLQLFQEDFELAVLVFQREFVEKLVAEPGFKEYSVLSVLADLLYQKEIVQATVSPKTFYPKPETFSAAIKFVRKKTQPKIKDFLGFIFFLKTLFRYRNKNLSNAFKTCANELKKIKGFNEKKALDYFVKKELDAVKVNLIYPEEFVEIFNSFTAK